MFLIKQLEQLGLTDKEAKVYKALLELGEATAQDLAIKSGVNRATTYVALESLMKKGLATSLAKKKKTYFIVETPLQILDLLYKQKEDIESRIGRAKKLMPELENLAQMTSERTMVKFYQGKEGVGLIQKDIIKSRPKQVLSIWNINLVLAAFPYSPDDHRQKRLKQKINTRTIAVYDPKLPVPKMPVFKGEDRRYLPANKFPFSSDITIYDNKAALLTVKDKLMGVIIDDNYISQSLSSLFELAWLGAQNYQSIEKNTKKA